MQTNVGEKVELEGGGKSVREDEVEELTFNEKT